MPNAQRLRRRIFSAITVAGLAAALPLASHTGATTATVAAFSAAPAPQTAAPEVVSNGFAGALPTAAESAALAAAAEAARAQSAARAVVAVRNAAARATRTLVRARLVAARTAAHHAAVVAAANRKAKALAVKKAAAKAKARAAALAARTPGDIAVEWARKMLGRPYVWGATGPAAFDCSGLTAYVWAHAGVWLSHYSGAQFGEGRRIDRSNLRAGDLVFFGWDLHHVGIYIGGGQMISAPHTGDVVRVQPIDRGDYAGAVRPA
ncbi:MAG: peptidoglycan DL-endopeptidase CwlO [Frankiaceae bacterium]|nr:peptidoglycan DL-endopeptidase CwlO [Frankiaceae bacterium]